MLESGRCIGRYRIGAPLGTGGMGAVYRAHDTLLRRDVALKVLIEKDEKDGASKEPRARLLREARAAAALRHPNAVAVFDVGEHEGITFIAMEVVEGSSLRKSLRDESVTRETKIRWLVNVAEVLAAAHDVGLVHRDVKPENVMVCADGTIKVLDFGIAKRTTGEAVTPEAEASADPSPESYRTREGMVTGTPRYMAPEQRSGGPIDGRTDQYAWGIVACELLAGGHPQKIDLEEAIEKAIADGLPEPVASAIMRALCGRPADRFPTMHAIVEQIAPFAAAPPRPSPSSPTTSSAMAVVLAEKTVPDAAPTHVDDRAHPQNATEPLGRRVPAAPVRGTRRKLFVVVAALAVASGVAAIASVSSHRTGGAASVSPGTPVAVATRAPLRVAVLPLDATGSDGDRAFLADEATEEIIGDLAREKDLRLIARASVMSFRDAGKTGAFDAVARSLDVSRIVAGKLRVDARELRLSLELVDVDPKGATTAWSRSYVRPANELANALRDAASDLKGALGVTATTRAQKTVLPEAHASFLQGRYFWYQRTEPALRHAIDDFKKATALDPRYADAWVGLANAWLVLPYYATVSEEEAEREAHGATERALSLDPLSSQAHAARADEHWEFHWDWRAAETAFRRSIELDPRNGVAHQWYGEMLTQLALHDRAIVEMKLALESDPANVPLLRTYGESLIAARRFVEAEPVFLRVLEMDANQPFAWFGVGSSLLGRGRFEEARVAFAKEGGAHPGDFQKVLRALGVFFVDAQTGKKDAVVRQAKAFEAAGFRESAPLVMAGIYAQAGEREKMYALLEHCVTTRARRTPQMNVGPVFDPYRDEPRFLELRKRAGFIVP